MHNMLKQRLSALQAYRSYTEITDKITCGYLHGSYVLLNVNGRQVFLSTGTTLSAYHHQFHTETGTGLSAPC